MASKKIKQYTHEDKKRLNNPQVGLVTPETDRDKEKKKYKYDPHLDPQLTWSGKAERTSFEIPTVSLHVHERIDPRTIIEKFIKKPTSEQISLFDQEEMPLREEIEFYQHEKGWTNRLIAGDSLLVMNSLLEKEGMSEKVQMIYFDPPYGIRYRSNFQPFVSKRSVSEKDEDLSTEPEMIKAFRDTWELGIHSYLSYLRDRILVCRKLLNDTGSIFIQISEENLHKVRLVLDEIFGEKNFVSQIAIKRASVMFSKKLLNTAVFYIVWYAKDINTVKYHQLFDPRSIRDFVTNAGSHLWIEDKKNGKLWRPSPSERGEIEKDLSDNPNLKLFASLSLNAQGTEKRNAFKYNGKKYFPPPNTQWKTSYDGLGRLKQAKRLIVEGNTVRYRQYYDDYPVTTINSLWEGIGAASNKAYVVQTPSEIVKRCILMATDPCDLVIDPTCGSGTTAFTSEKYGRRWITCDTSRVAISIARKRLLTSLYKYYQVQDSHLGITSGLVYKKTPHLTLGSITSNNPPIEEILYDQPEVDTSKIRITGPFTVEAVPSPVAKSFEKVPEEKTADTSVSRKGETIRQEEWRDELLKTGIRGKGGQYINFSRVEPLQGTKYIQAEAETIPEKGKDAKRVLIVFGPEHAPLEQRLVSLALDEAQNLRPRPDMVLFLAFQFDSEAAKDIDETKWPGITLLRAQMNADLFTDDLKKKRSSNDSFWLIGQPDVSLKMKDKKYVIEVKGFDYYNTKTGTVESGGPKNIAMWMLDEDYDGRSLYPAQIFFPMTGAKGGWRKLARNLKAEVDEELIEQFRGTKSLPFEAGEYKQIAVKIIDDRGIESLRIIKL